LGFRVQAKHGSSYVLQKNRQGARTNSTVQVQYFLYCTRIVLVQQVLEYSLHVKVSTHNIVLSQPFTTITYIISLLVLWLPPAEVGTRLFILLLDTSITCPSYWCIALPMASFWAASAARSIVASKQTSSSLLLAAATAGFAATSGSVNSNACSSCEQDAARAHLDKKRKMKLQKRVRFECPALQLVLFSPLHLVLTCLLLWLNPPTDDICGPILSSIPNSQQS
jgi:hypothetical protein